MTTKGPRKFWRLDRDGRLSPQANRLNWRVVAVDRDRVDPAADYLFCAPDFLFPADGIARALRLEVDPRPSVPNRRAGGGSSWDTAMGPGR
jgi:hypothetical protein